MVTMIINIEEDLKKSFGELANNLGTNPTNLAKMLMKNAVNTQKISFKVKPVLDLKIEPFTDEEYENIAKNKNIQKNTKELKKILAKYKQE
jgi:antitoxin component of RelBE/YafQ-DinJ toxin-antitoxin module